ncbi:MlaA family lipoprotein [Sulfurimonas sp.]|uniref:MlaA family lipoprotein n=1 Tax=Sulfurimonas sp. TaxID=2022749 RepID=UPI003D1123DE
MRTIYLSIVSCMLVFGLSACSSKSVAKPEEAVQTQKSDGAEDELASFADEMEVQEIYDPLKGYNRAMTRFNDGAYEYVFKPVATGYKNVLHFEVRNSIENFFENLYFPVRFANTLLQGKFSYAAEEAGRFVCNTTVGVLGFFDPAKSYFELEAHEEDFGQTLGFYGVGGGPHIVLPLLGPSNLRDTLSLYPDSFLSLLDYEERSYWTLTDTPAEYIGVKVLEKTNTISLHMDKYDKMKEDAVDLYPFLRDMYEQRRKKQIEE